MAFEMRNGMDDRIKHQELTTWPQDIFSMSLINTYPNMSTFGCCRNLENPVRTKRKRMFRFPVKVDNCDAN